MAAHLAAIPISDVIAELIQSHDRIKAAQNPEDAHESIFRSWCTRLAAMAQQVTPSDVKKLTSAIDEGPWTEEQKIPFTALSRSLKRPRPNAEKGKHASTSRISYHQQR